MCVFLQTTSLSARMEGLLSRLQEMRERRLSELRDEEDINAVIDVIEKK